MSKKSIAEWFAEKAASVEALLGKAQDKVVFDTIKNRHYQLFEHGVIIGKVVDETKLSHLTCTYGKLFHIWWGNKDGDWVGAPLEDLYETTNFAGAQIMVQRFEHGVIWCRSDGSDDVHWLSWRDWNAISEPGNNSDKHR